MPFSSQFEQQFIELADAAIMRVKFETKEDISLFCQNALLKLINSQQVSSSKYDEDINDLQELIDDGFDLYATNNIVDRVNKVNRTLEANAGFIEIPAFTPARELLAHNNASENKEREIKISTEDKIKEARAEFKKIIINQIKTKLDELSSMNESQQTQYIENQYSKQREAEEKQQIMIRAAAMPRSTESQTITEEEWMRRENPSLELVRARFPGLFNVASQQSSQQNRSVIRNISLATQPSSTGLPRWRQWSDTFPTIAPHHPTFWGQRQLNIWEENALRSFRVQGLTEDMLRQAINNSNHFTSAHFNALGQYATNIPMSAALRIVASLSREQAEAIFSLNNEESSSAIQPEVKRSLEDVFIVARTNCRNTLSNIMSVPTDNSRTTVPQDNPLSPRSWRRLFHVQPEVKTNNPLSQRDLNFRERVDLRNLRFLGLTEDMFRQAFNNEQLYTEHHSRVLYLFIENYNMPLNESFEQVAQLSQEEARNMATSPLNANQVRR